MMDDPIALFLARRAAAVEAGAAYDGTAAALATATADGRPSVRMVLVKEVGPDGFHVYTNLESRKGREMAGNARAALCFHWPEIGEQLRIEGPVELLDADTSDAYFASRPRASQLGAWASPQSRPIEGREVLIDAASEKAREVGEGEIARPPFWGGYRIVPERIERWIEGAGRLHDRWAYDRDRGGWRVTRLAP